MFKRGFFTLLLSLVLVLSLAATAYAGHGNGKGKKQWKFNGKVNLNRVQLVDINSHWAYQPIDVMYSYGIIMGYPDLTFRPNSPVTKYEAIMMISRAAGFTGTFDSENSWGKDVPAWMTDCLNFAVSEDILTEEEAEDLEGWKPAKRYEVAVWATRAMGLEMENQLSFQDKDEIPFFARPYVGGMYRMQYMVGYPGNYFQPNKPVTRAEMASVLYKILLESLNNPAEDNEEDEVDEDTADEVTVRSLNPANGSDDVDEDTKELVVRFNVDIQPVDDLDDVLEGITVENVDDETELEIDDVTIKGKTLTIELDEALEEGKTYRVTIEEDVLEAKESGVNFEGIEGSDWEFSAGDTLRLVRLTPKNGADDVEAGTDVLEARFSADIRVISGKTLLNGVKVYNLSLEEEVAVEQVEIDDDTLIITLEDPLEEGDEYQVTIKGGYFEDEETGVNFEGLDGEDWQFTVADN